MATTTIHSMALDGIVNVNSLFTVATFIGLNLASTTLLDPASACAATSTVAENLVASHVYSFSSFLFSSLIAFALKQAIRTTREVHHSSSYYSSRYNTEGYENRQSDSLYGTLTTHVNRKALRAGILVSAAGSAAGCVFLTLALVDLIQIKLGVLNCWGWYTLAAIAPLVTLVPSALVTYICLVLHAFTR